MHIDRLSFLTPGLSSVFEVANQFFLLGIHADDGPSSQLKDLFLALEQLKLLLPLRMRFTSPKPPAPIAMSSSQIYGTRESDTSPHRYSTGWTPRARGRKIETSVEIAVCVAISSNSRVQPTRPCVRMARASGTSAMQWSMTAEGVSPWDEPGRKFG